MPPTVRQGGKSLRRDLHFDCYYFLKIQHALLRVYLVIFSSMQQCLKSSGEIIAIIIIKTMFFVCVIHIIKCECNLL